MDPRDAIKKQEGLIVSLRADLSARSQIINKLEARTKELAETKEEALRERDEALGTLELRSLDLAQAQMDHADEARGRAADARKHAEELAERDGELARRKSLEAELSEAKEKLAQTIRDLNAAERDAAQQQLARDAALHEMHVWAVAEREAAVAAVRNEAEAERAELVRAHEQAFGSVRDQAVAQALTVLKKKKAK